MTNSLDWLTLSLVPGLGLTGYWRLIQTFGGPGAVLQASSAARGKVPGIRAEVLKGLADPEPFRQEAVLELARLHDMGAECLAHDDLRYPDLLRQTFQPPPLLFVQGRLELLGGNAVAMVGSRAATSYGLRIAETLATGLAGAGLLVVSGLAMGIDAAAHQGALQAGGGTIAVLGCGLDVVYPQQNKKLYDQIRADGVLVSEYPLGTRPDAYRFPARNRIIAGLSHGVIVVEAARKSGSLITAEMALDQGREVFAVPGQIDSFKSAGTHWLLQQGAKLVHSLDDILEELSLVARVIENGSEVADDPMADLEPEAAALLAKIEPYAMNRDDLIAISGLSAARVAELLLLFELDGLVEIVPGGGVCRSEYENQRHET